MRNEKLLIGLLAGAAVLLAGIIVIVIVIASQPLQGGQAQSPSSGESAKSQPAASNAAPSPRATTPSSSANPTRTASANDGSISSSEASAQVLKFYNAYLSGASTRDGAKQVVQQYGTASFVNAWQASSGKDPVMCANAWSNNKFSVSNSSATGGVATVNVVDAHTDGTSQTIQVTAVSQSGSIKVDAIACPAGQ